MQPEAGVEKIQSDILSEEEVENVLSDNPNEEETTQIDTSDVELPSEQDDKPEQTVEELQKQIEELKAKLENPEPTNQEPSTELVEEYVAKYQDQGGELSEKDYQELAAKGYTKEFVDTYIQGMNAKVQAEQQARVKELAEPYGGEAELQKAIQWARDNWQEADKKSFNESISTGDEAVQKLLVASLMREYSQAGTTTAPQTNGPIHSNAAPPQPSKGYDTKSAMMKDMADPRYRTDASFNAKVQEKVMATDQSKWYDSITSL